MSNQISKLATVVEGDPKAPFSLATTPICWEGATPIPGLPHFTLDTYLIMLSVKQGGIKYNFLSLWYDSTWDWTPVSPATLPTRSMDRLTIILKFILFFILFIWLFIFLVNTQKYGINIYSSHRSISFRESMPLLRESVTHWPINWQSALIPSPSQELFFWSLFCRRDNVRESLELAEGTYLSYMIALIPLGTLRSLLALNTLPTNQGPAYRPATQKRHFLTLIPSRLLL